MKVILSQEDIETLIKKSFEGVKSATFNKEISSFELDVGENFKERKQPISTEKVPDTPIPTAEKNEDEARKGLMQSGGIRRNIMHMG